jgi:acyl-CoA thioester hydrolase
MEAEGAQPARPVYRKTITVRYGECDMQGVVFNPNYMVYIDDVCDGWLIAALGRDWNSKFDCVVKKATLEWHSAAHHGDAIAFDLSVVRWGNTSFDVMVDATVDGRQVITATLVYISVQPGSHLPVPVPEAIRRELATPRD